MKQNMHTHPPHILMSFVELPYTILGQVFIQMVKKFHIFIIAEQCSTVLMPKSANVHN